MRAAGIVASILSLTIAGWALEPARPVFFSDEPVVLFTPRGADAPVLSFNGESYPLTWTSTPDGGQTRWEGALPEQAPLGIWVASSGSDCVSFLRVPPDWAVLELQGVAGLLVEAPGRWGLPGPQGTVVAGPAGEWQVRYSFPGLAASRSLDLSLAPHEWRTIPVGYMELTPSTPLVLPGYDFLLKVRILSPVGISSLTEALTLPPGWGADPTYCQECPPELDEPVPEETPTDRAWLVHVPPTAPVGEYTLRVQLPGAGLSGEVRVEVVRRLPVSVVVSHWDTQADRLDLTLDQGITYQQLLWAVSLLGREVPYSGRTMTQEMLDRLAELWAQGGP